jgi:hypothetical protein
MSSAPSRLAQVQHRIAERSIGREHRSRLGRFARITGRNTMADDPKKTATDRTRIDVNQDYEYRYWSKKFGVSPDELKVAAAAAGPMSDDIARHLGKA